MTRDIDQDLRPLLDLSCKIEEAKRKALEPDADDERTPADAIRQSLAVLAMEIEHPRPDKDLQRAAIARLLRVCQRLERAQR